MTVDTYMCDAHTQVQTSSHTHHTFTTHIHNLQHTYTIYNTHTQFTTHIHNLQHTYTTYNTDPSLPSYPFPLFSIYNARTNTTTHAHPTPTYDAPFTTPLLPPPTTPAPNTHTQARTHTHHSFLSFSVCPRVSATFHSLSVSVHRNSSYP